MRCSLLAMAIVSLGACGGNTAEPPPPSVPPARPVTVDPPPAAPMVPAKVAEPDDKKACADSRAKRAADAKDMVTARYAKEILFKTTGKQIRANCKLANDRPFTPVARSGSGWNVTSEMRDSVKCSGALPGGVSKDDAYLLLATDRSGDKTFTSGPVLAPEDHAPDDTKCASFDKAAGLDLFAPTYGDEASVKKVLDWRAP